MIEVKIPITEADGPEFNALIQNDDDMEKHERCNNAVRHKRKEFVECFNVFSKVLEQGEDAYFNLKKAKN